MKDTCKQAIFKKDTRSRSRAEDPLRAGDQEVRELEFFNNPKYSFYEEQSHQANESSDSVFAMFLLTFQVEPMYILVQNLRFSLHIS